MPRPYEIADLKEDVFNEYSVRYYQPVYDLISYMLRAIIKRTLSTTIYHNNVRVVNAGIAPVIDTTLVCDDFISDLIAKRKL